MVAGLVVAIIGGMLIGRPPLGIPGAVVLVLGGILFAVAATWIVRNSWDPAEWPEVVPITQIEALRKLRKWLIFHIVLLATMMTFVVASVALGWSVSWGLWILLASEIIQVILHTNAIRRWARETSTPEHPPASP